MKRQNKLHSLYSQQGLTLLELMITLSIVGILLTLVAPNVRDILIRNNVTSQVNEISGIVQFARSNAIDEQNTAIICPTPDFSNCSTNWDQAKMVFNDLDGNGNRSEDEELLAATSLPPKSMTVTGPGITVRFNGNGTVSTPATIKICHQDGEAKFARALFISLQGRVRLSEDTDNNGIHEDSAGNSLSCI
ncbi:GspH/FimT family pseudopilin [Bowmanella yangjiangensis]|uniref:Type II secretion system protein H n=1 Tax=Bowmanella yangjiangensis TaxID=2811230 RepID=A0ABS3CY50_9ALTE|nr:GspH/FimT family pseudopilin [Bowmanella yangjiangensis]MBN7822042.1 GspH/FimT family pseudopilin [Bowmanella yangjiangensis]